MATMTRGRALRLVGVGIGTSLAHAITVRPLLAQDPEHVLIGTAGKGGVFYPLGISLAHVISKYAAGLKATALVTSGAADNMRLVLPLFQETQRKYYESGLKCWKHYLRAENRYVKNERN